MLPSACVGDYRYLFLAGSILILIAVGLLLEGLPALIILGDLVSTARLAPVVPLGRPAIYI
jgi:hypothetical protein